MTGVPAQPHGWVFALTVVFMRLAAAESFQREFTAERKLFAASPLEEQRSASNSTCCAELNKIGFSSNLPVIVLQTDGDSIPWHIDTNVSMCTCANGAGFADYTGQALAAGRGSSSANFTKKSFKIQLMKDGQSQDFAFLGMPADDDWILYGPELDRTLGMRNYLTYNLARASGRYATRTVYCEVFVVLGGQSLSMEHYNGLYIAEEKVKRGVNRVDISKLTPPNLSGGYIFLYDNDNIIEGDVTFGPLPAWGHPFLLKYPSKAPDGGAQLLEYLTEFQTALGAPDWLQRQDNSSYTAFIEFDSWVDFFLLVELTKNPDGYRGSTYMHKDRNGPIAMGPAWDYNEAYGQCCGYPIDGWQRGGDSGPGASGGSAVSPEGWRFNICADLGRCLVDPGDGTSRWFRRMWEDPRFRNAVAQRWIALRAGPWSDAALTSLISDTSVQISQAAHRNYERFASVLLGDNVTDGVAEWTFAVGQLHDWLLKHVAWIDSAVNAAAGSRVATPSAVDAPAGRRL